MTHPRHIWITSASLEPCECPDCLPVDDEQDGEPDFAAMAEDQRERRALALADLVERGEA